MTTPDLERLIAELCDAENINRIRRGEVQPLRTLMLDAALALSSAQERINALQGGAERYWEARWREADAAISSARAAGREEAAQICEKLGYVTTEVGAPIAGETAQACAAAIRCHRLPTLHIGVAHDEPEQRK